MIAGSRHEGKLQSGGFAFVQVWTVDYNSQTPPDLGELSVPYQYLDHEADIAIQGIGDSLAEAFAEAAHAVFAVLADIRAVVPRLSLAVRCQAPDVDTLLVEFLNELLFQREMHGWLLSKCQVTEIGEEAGEWRLDAVVWGEPLDPTRHEIGIEVKAATYAALRVFQRDGQYVAQCILDV